jgi:thioredoxin 1
MSKILKLHNINELNNFDDSKTIIIKVGADWCSPCKSIYPLYSQFAEFNKNDNIIYTSIDVDDADAELLDFIEVKSLPTFHIYKNKQICETIVGGDKFAISNCINNL